jgi:hypothetical protein
VGAVIALAAIAILTINCVGELKRQLLTNPCSKAAGRARNKVTACDRDGQFCPSTPESGESNDTTGAVDEGATTLKALAKLPLWASGLVTVAVYPPVVAPASIVRFAVN